MILVKLPNLFDNILEKIFQLVSEMEFSFWYALLSVDIAFFHVIPLLASYDLSLGLSCRSTNFNRVPHFKNSKNSSFGDLENCVLMFFFFLTFHSIFFGEVCNFLFSSETKSLEFSRRIFVTISIHL